MFVESFKNNGIPYVRLVRNDRVTNSKGIKTSTKTVVLNIGPVSRFDDGLPNYVERLKKSFNLSSLHSFLTAKKRLLQRFTAFPLQKAARTV